MAQPVPINLKPNKPEPFDGKRDYLVANTWLYKIKQYLALLQFGNPRSHISEETKITFSTTLLTGTTAEWWFPLVQGPNSPSTWVSFKQAIVREFIQSDHVRRACDRLRKLQQSGSVPKYLSEIRNIALMVPDMNEGEK